MLYDKYHIFYMIHKFIFSCGGDVNGNADGFCNDSISGGGSDELGHR